MSTGGSEGADHYVTIESVHFSSPDKIIKYVKNIVTHVKHKKYTILLLIAHTDEPSVPEGPIDNTINNRMKK